MSRNVVEPKPSKSTPLVASKLSLSASSVTASSTFLCTDNPSKLCAEVSWFLFFFLWSSVVTVVMVGGFASVWGDVALMSLGVGLCIATFAVPAYLKMTVIDHIVPKWFGVKLTAPERLIAVANYTKDLTTMFAGVLSLSVMLNLLMTPFFFDVLHMRFGFHVEWTFDRNPLFLYFLTVPYFSSYSVWGSMLYRKLKGAFERSTTFQRLLSWGQGTRLEPSKQKQQVQGNIQAAPLLRATSTVLRAMVVNFLLPAIVSFLLAFLETLFMANPLIDEVFCYDDVFLTLTFGSMCYGVSFLFAIWSWIYSVPECVTLSEVNKSYRRKRSGGEGTVHAVVSSFFTGVLTWVVLGWIRVNVAPIVTVVVNDSPSFGGCLLK